MAKTKSTSISTGTTTGMDLSGTQTRQTGSITEITTSATQEIVPYIGACTLAFKGTSLKPNTVVYPYLDGILWTQYTAPGLPNNSVTDTSNHNIVYTTGAPGATLRTNANGAIWGKFTIPSGRIATGTINFGVVDANGAFIDESKLIAAELGYTGDCTTYAHGSFTADRILIHNSQVLSPVSTAVGIGSGIASSSASAAGAAAGAGAAGAAGACFTSDTLIAMADGTTKKISEVVIGDRVYNRNKTSINTVTFLEHSEGEFDLYTPLAKVKPFATADHPIYIEDSLYSVSPEATFEVYPWLGKTNQLNVAKLSKSKKIRVYNLWVDGDQTYTVNGYGTTTIIGDGGLMKNAYRLDSISHDQVIGMMSYFFKEGNGRNLSYGAYLVNKYIGKLNSNIITRVLTRVLLNGKQNIAGKPLTAANKFIHFVAGTVGSIAWSLKNIK